MKITFTAKGTDWESEIDPRFGRTDYFVTYNEETNELTYVDNRAIENEAHGAGPKTAQKLFELKTDVLITGNGPGGNAVAVLKNADIEINVGAGQLTVKEAYQAYKKNNLIKFN